MKSVGNMLMSEIEAKGLTHLLKPQRRRRKLPLRTRKPLDKHQQFSMSYWYGLIVKDYNKLRPVQRTRIALECWKVLASKINTIPVSPEDSALNANDAMTMLKEIEAGIAPKDLQSVKSGDLPPSDKEAENNRS
jgi:hypothetical protein